MAQHLQTLGFDACGRGQSDGWRKMKPGIGPQVFVHATYQGNPFWGYPIFDSQMGVAQKPCTNMEAW